jgi:hypothetical protein
VNPWRFAGYGAPVKGWCSRPQKVVRIGTDEWCLKRCKSPRSSRCEYCAAIHRGDVAAVGRSGWTDRPTDRAFWTTLTAPGAKVLPWDRSKCMHSPGVKCSGKDHGCQADANALAIWHDDIGKRWSRVIEDVRRELNPGQTALPVSKRDVQLEYMRTWEPQKRGALHAHSMMRVTGPASAARVIEVITAAALRHGFGPEMKIEVINIADPEQAARKAGYTAKYAAKCAEELGYLRRLNPDTGELRLGGLRSWSASWNWGDTMKAIHLRRCQWASSQRTLAGGPPGAAGGPPAGAVGGGLDSNQEISAMGTPTGSILDTSASVQPV